MRSGIMLCGFALMLSLAGCGGLSPNAVVVLPEANGHVGAVVVTPKQGAGTVLDQAYASAQGGQDGRMTAQPAEPDEVAKVFARALSARPVPPKSFTLYFQEGTDELTAASKPLFDGVLAEIAARPAVDVLVTGHTDRVGRLVDNDRLALRRAESMRDTLVAHGIAASAISVAGRGEREPLVPTADDVPEERNRRVEIFVR